MASGLPFAVGSSYVPLPGDIAPSTNVPPKSTAGILATDVGLPTTSPSPSPTPVVTSSQVQDPSSTVSAASTSSSAATASSTHGSPGWIKIVAIVVPIVAVILFVPLIYLLYRSHRMKKNAENRSSQRYSQEAMITKEKENVEVEKNGPPPPRPRRSPPDAKAAPTPRPTNSLGLFNFDLSSPSSPTGQQTPPRLSIARSLQFRRSQASVVSSERKSQHQNSDRLRDPLRNNPTTSTRDSSTVVYTPEPPPPYLAPAGAHAPETQFAPLNMIGTAVSQPPRPRPNRNPSSGNSIPHISRPPSQPPPPNPTSHKERPLPPPPINTTTTSDHTNVPNNRSINPPVSAYSDSNYHDSLQPQPHSTSGGQIIPQPESRPVSPIDNDDRGSSSTNFHVPSFGLGMGGRFTLTDYSQQSTNNTTTTNNNNNNNDAHHNHSHDQGGISGSSSGIGFGIGLDNNLNTLSTSTGTGTNNLNVGDRISDISGLSVDPTWLSQEERERRGYGRQSTASDGGGVSPIESHADRYNGRRGI